MTFIAQKLSADWPLVAGWIYELKWTLLKTNCAEVRIQVHPNSECLRNRLNRGSQAVRVSGESEKTGGGIPPPNTFRDKLYSTLLITKSSWVSFLPTFWSLIIFLQELRSKVCKATRTHAFNFPLQAKGRMVMSFSNYLGMCSNAKGPSKTPRATLSRKFFF